MSSGEVAQEVKVEVSRECFRPPGILKMIQILFGVIIFGLADWGKFFQVLIRLTSKWIPKLKDQLDTFEFTGYNFVLVATVILFIVTFISLLFYVCRHHPFLRRVDWSKVEIVFNVMVAIFYLIIMILASMSANKLSKFDGVAISEEDFDNVVHRWTDHVIAVAVFAGLNVVLHLASVIYFFRFGTKDNFASAV